MRSRDDLIRGLSSRPAPVRTSIAPVRLAAFWLLGAAVLCATGMVFSGPFRESWWSQLLTVPQFSIEVGLGLVAILCLAWVGFELGQPGAPAIKRKLRWAWAALGAWFLSVALGLVHPALAPGSSSYRAYCFLEVLGYGALLCTGGLLVLRRLAPLRRGLVGLLIGAVAGAVPAFLMQLGCMYDPTHNLAWHLAPVFAVALLGACLGRLLLREI